MTIKVSLTVAFLAGVLTKNVATAQETYFCPWADNIVRIHLVDDRSHAYVQDATDTLDGSEMRDVTNTSTSVGAAEVPVSQFQFNDGGFRYFFEIRHWSFGSRLENTRLRFRDNNIFRGAGWCIKYDRWVEGGSQ